MLKSTLIENLIKENLPTTQVIISTKDQHHFDAVIVSSAFNNLSLLERQRKVYAVLEEKILDGEIHALSFKTYTPEEYEEIA